MIPAEPIAGSRTNPAGPQRLASLDIVRGVAVMGILAMNIVAFAMPIQAYFNPFAYGYHGPADLAAWAFNFILVDGKMRGLFSFLFGASTLLVIERAEAAGSSAAGIHYARMLWLLVFGLLHFTFLWFGDILALYALVGLIAFLFRRLPVRALIGWGIGLVLLELAILGAMAAAAFHLQAQVALANPSAEAVAQWRSLQADFGPPSAQTLAQKLSLFGGPYRDLVVHQLGREHMVLSTLFLFGAETLGYFLFGMAALKSGFLSGAWSEGAYRRIALIGFGIGIPAYALLAWILLRSGFDLPVLLAGSLAATVPFRPPMVIATAASIILLARRGGRLVDRIAAAGRVAFTNYLGTSVLMTGLFYGWGFGLYGSLGRAELWAVVLAMWALMLAWSKPWLDRFRYGPFEWLWRSLSRWQVQPMRRAAA